MNRGLVDKDICRAIFGDNKPITLFGIKPFHGSILHGRKESKIGRVEATGSLLAKTGAEQLKHDWKNLMLVLNSKPCGEDNNK